MSVLATGQRDMRPWSQAAWLSAQACGVPAVRWALLALPFRWYGVISEPLVRACCQTLRPFGMGMVRRSPNPRTPLSVPK
ncbi:hypothetical protein D3C87_1116110 [compost metagenome]